MSQCEFVGNGTRRRCDREATALVAAQCTACGEITETLGCDRCVRMGGESMAENALSIRHIPCGAVGAIRLSEPIRLRAVAS